MFRRGDQSHVSFWKGLCSDLGYGAQDRKGAVLLDGLSDNRFMTGACHAVQDDAADVHLGVELDTAQDRGGHGTGTLGSINDEDHRRLEELGKFRGAGRPFKVNAVVETSVSFNNRKVAWERAMRKGEDNLFGRHQEGVQIMTGAAGPSGQPPRINKVRSLLKGGNGHPALAPGCDQPQRDHRLPRTPAQGSNQNPGKSHKQMVCSALFVFFCVGLFADPLETDQGRTPAGPVLKGLFTDHLVNQVLYRSGLLTGEHLVEVLQIELGFTLFLLKVFYNRLFCCFFVHCLPLFRYVKYLGLARHPCALPEGRAQGI